MKLLLLTVSLPLLAASIETASAAVGISAAGVAVDFAAVPTGADFASVSVTGAGGDLTVPGTGANGMDNTTTGVSAALAWPAAATVWSAAANTIATEPATSALGAPIRHVVNPGKMLTGPTGNRFHALIGRFQNLSGIPVGTMDISWTLGSPVDSGPGSAAVGTDPLAGIHVYFSRTGAIGSWTRLNGPFGAPDGPVASATLTVPGRLGIGSELYIAWIDDNGPGSGTPNFEGNYTVDDVGISNLVEAACSVPAVVTGPSRAPGADLVDPTDDRIVYSAIINGSGAVGPGWIVAAGPSQGTTGSYGTGLNLDLPISDFSGGPLVLKVQDQSDVDCYFETAIAAPPFVHKVTGANSPAITFSPSALGDGSFVPAPAANTEPGWTGGTAGAITNSNVQTQPAPSSQLLKYFHITTNGVTFITDRVDVNAIKGQILQGDLEFSFYSTSASGLDTGDALTSRIEVAQDGDFANTAAGNIISVNIKDVPAAETPAFGVSIAAAPSYINLGTAAGQTPFPATDFTFHKFAANVFIPDTASDPHARIVVQSIAGISNSEHLLVDNIVFRSNTNPTLNASTGAALWNNNNTVTTTDDSFLVPVSISGFNLGASPGWNSNETPVRSGAYTDPNPVTFGPYPGRTPVNVQLSDQSNSAVMSSVLALAPPAITFTLTPGPNPVVRNFNGPGDADDTVTFELMVSGTNGGPEFRMDSYPAVATTPSLALTAVPVNITVTVSPVPDQGTLLIIFRDASYPATSGGILVPIPAVAATQYIIGQKDLGAGLSDVVTDPASFLPIEWMNFPGIRALEMTSGGGGAAKVVTSERIDLTGVSGNVQFSARLRAIDRSAGFEAGDSFHAELILDDDINFPVNLVSPYDTVLANGVMNGGVAAADDEFNIARAADGSFTSDFTLSHLIPDNVNAVRLIISAVNDSNNETFVVENVLFTISSAGDSDGDGVSDADEATMGTSPNDPNDVLRLSQDAGNPNQINFPTVNGRYYRIYASDDSDDATHLQVWKDAGPATLIGNGNPATFNITIDPGESRRFYRVHVMQTDGPLNDGVWPATRP